MPGTPIYTYTDFLTWVDLWCLAICLRISNTVLNHLQQDLKGVSEMSELTVKLLILVNHCWSLISGVAVSLVNALKVHATMMDSVWGA